MAKKAQKRAGAKRASPADKRDLVRRPKASAYAKRTARGRFKDMDRVGPSQKADKARKAKKRVRSGYGDQGDKRPKTARRTRR
jgi:inorganic pyrophosphatase